MKVHLFNSSTGWEILQDLPSGFETNESYIKDNYSAIVLVPKKGTTRSRAWDRVSSEFDQGGLRPLYCTGFFAYARRALKHTRFKQWVDNKERVVICYDGPSGSTERVVDLTLGWSGAFSEYIKGYCHLRKEERVFCLDHITLYGLAKTTDPNLEL